MHNQDSAAYRSKIGQHKTWTVILASLGVFMTALDTLVVTTSLPALRVDLHSSLSNLEWTVNAYNLAFACFILTGAALGDRFGRRRMFTLGIGLFTAASAAAALSPNVGALIAARAVQGAGAAIVFPLTLTLISEAFPVEKRGAAIGLWGGITGLAVADVTGRGTGIDDATWARKLKVIEQALSLHKPNATQPLDVLAKLGGLEIAGLVGVVLGAAARRIPVVIDGFIATAAALVATELCQAARSYLIAAHRSVEIGHHAALERMELEPLFALDLRLGEGTGAALALPLLDAALALLDEMATFEEAGIAGALAITTT